MPLHPLAVHLPIALFTISFLTLMYWLLRGLSTAVFDNRLQDFAHFATALGLAFLLLTVAFGLWDATHQGWVRFGQALSWWLDVKIGLAALAAVVYLAFLRLHSRKRRYLNEDTGRMLWCLGLQLGGYLLMAALTLIGTLLVYAPHALP